jgi:hypothetical protein
VSRTALVLLFIAVLAVAFLSVTVLPTAIVQLDGDPARLGPKDLLAAKNAARGTLTSRRLEWFSNSPAGAARSGRPLSLTNALPAAAVPAVSSLRCPP